MNQVVIASLHCQMCAYGTPERPINISVGLWLIHIVKNHWNIVCLLRVADRATIVEMFEGVSEPAEKTPEGH